MTRPGMDSIFVGGGILKGDDQELGAGTTAKGVADFKTAMVGSDSFSVVLLAALT